MRLKETKLKFLIETEKEKEGYIKSVKSLLKDCENIKELGKGMHGVLANIIEVPEEYQTAIEMCLGASLQNIVTETEEDAKKLVNHLRKNNLGRASFLPISSVRGKKLEKIKGNNKGIYGIASDLIKFDKKYSQIITNLLGRTVIVDNMDTAIQVAKQNGYTFRIITIEGDIINPSGAITGGSVAKKSANILGRGREIEKLQKEVKNLKNKIESITKEKEEFEKSNKETLELAESLEKELQEKEITYATEKQKIEYVKETASLFTDAMFEYFSNIQMGVISFSSVDTVTTPSATLGTSNDAQLVLPLSNSSETIKNSINSYGQTVGPYTNIEAGLELAQSNFSDSTDSEKYIVLISDGVPNLSLDTEHTLTYSGVNAQNTKNKVLSFTAVILSKISPFTVVDNPS